jgi:hypothetical protein
MVVRMALFYQCAATSATRSAARFSIVHSENARRPQLSTTEDTGDTERNLLSSVSSVVASFYTDMKTAYRTDATTATRTLRRIRSPRGERRLDALRRERHLTNAGAGRIKNGVRDRGRDQRNRRLAGAHRFHA